MQQFFEGRTKITFEELKKEEKVSDKYFAGERIDDKCRISSKIIYYSTFANIGFRESELIGLDLKFCVFINCYFRRTKFSDVNFTGSIFINCNFKDIDLYNCIFDYCKFEGCFIDYDDIKGCLSDKPNIRWSLLNNLAIESLSQGQDKEYRKFLLAGKEASEQYYFKKVFHSGKEKYYQKYNFWDRVSGFFDLILSKVSKYLWGYGEKLSNLVIDVILIHAVFTISFYFIFPKLDEAEEMTFWKANYISMSNLLTVSCNYSVDQALFRNLSLIESGLGIIMLGFFVAALFKRISRR